MLCDLGQTKVVVYLFPWCLYEVDGKTIKYGGIIADC